MSVVPSAEAYVVANFKETQLTDVRRGQPVDIEVDMFPGRVYHGHVDSLAPASGQTFALLPPDNATGNFTKVVQRIPGQDRARRQQRRCAATCGPACRSRRDRHQGAPRALSKRLSEQALEGLSDVQHQHDRSGAPVVASAPRASTKDWIAVLACMIGAFMAILNIQITNASLLDIEGGIGTGVDNGAWISTAYLIGEIVVIPLTDYLSRVFSFRRYLLVNAVLFPLFSIGCAFTHDLGSMIVMRGLQGFAGGILIPMAFTIVLTKLPKPQQPIGLALFSLAVTFAPGDRADDRRLSHRELRLADDLLHQRRPERDHGRGAVLHAGQAADAARASEGGRLGRHRHDGDRPFRVPDRARRGREGRLVRLAVHLPPGDRRRGVPRRLHLDRTDGEEAAGQPAAARRAAISASASSPMSWSASRCSAPSISCRNISARCSATTPSRSARFSPGPACRNCC